MSSTALVTAAELERLSLPDKQVELVRGRLAVREPPGSWHGALAAELAFRIQTFVKQHRLGLVFAQDTGFKIGSNPDTVRAPDVAFITSSRLVDLPRRGYAALAPDLAAEIVSPDDGPGEVLAKVADWLEAGVRLVWVIDSQRRLARIYRPDGTLSQLSAEESLDGEDVLPGFVCPVAPLFELYPPSP